jgi:hypothetical protein
MKQNGRKGGTDWLAELRRPRADVVRSELPSDHRPRAIERNVTSSRSSLCRPGRRDRCDRRSTSCRSCPPGSSSAERQGRVSSASHGLYGQSLSATPLVSPVRRADEAIRRTHGRDRPRRVPSAPGHHTEILHLSMMPGNGEREGRSRAPRAGEPCHHRTLSRGRRGGAVFDHEPDEGSFDLVDRRNDK